MSGTFVAKEKLLIVNMNPKVLKRIAYFVSGFVLLCAVTYGIFAVIFSRRAHKTYIVQVREIAIPDDSASIAAGGHLYRIKGCGECHGADLGGKVVFDDPPLGRIFAGNLTSGKGGLARDFDDQDWLKALRHGLNTENRPLHMMPSEEFARLDDHDMGAIIAFCKAQPPVDGAAGEIVIGPVGKILTVLGKIPLFSAEKIDHDNLRQVVVQKGVTKAYGAYLSVACTGCHGTSLKGGSNPVPGGVPVADITSSGRLGKWTRAQFIAALRTGKTPEGKQLQVKDMPWTITAEYTDEELGALFLYLKSVI